MAEAKAKASVDQDRELVPYEAYFDGERYKEDIHVTVNGKTWVIKRGVPVMIPRFVYDVLMKSEAQDKATARQIRKLENQYISDVTKYLG